MAPSVCQYPTEPCSRLTPRYSSSDYCESHAPLMALAKARRYQPTPVRAPSTAIPSVLGPVVSRAPVRVRPEPEEDLDDAPVVTTLTPSPEAPGPAQEPEPASPTTPPQPTLSEQIPMPIPAAIPPAPPTRPTPAVRTCSVEGCNNPLGAGNKSGVCSPCQKSHRKTARRVGAERTTEGVAAPGPAPKVLARASAPGPAPAPLAGLSIDQLIDLRAQLDQVLKAKQAELVEQLGRLNSVLQPATATEED